MGAVGPLLLMRLLVALAVAASAWSASPLLYRVDQPAVLSTDDVNGFSAARLQALGVTVVASVDASIDAATSLNAIPGGPWYDEEGLAAVNRTQSSIRGMVQLADTAGLQLFVSSDVFEMPDLLLARYSRCGVHHIVTALLPPIPLLCAVLFVTRVGRVRGGGAWSSRPCVGVNLRPTRCAPLSPSLAGLYRLGMVGQRGSRAAVALLGVRVPVRRVAVPEPRCCGGCLSVRYGPQLVDPNATCAGYRKSPAGCIMLTNFTRYAYQVLFDEVLTALPGIDGVVRCQARGPLALAQC
jgi:hypothetical protein